MRAVAYIFPDPTSAFTVAPLVARKVERLVRSVFVLGMPLSSMTESVARGTGRRQVWGWRSLQSVPRDAAPSGVRVRRPRPGRKPVRSVEDPCRFSFTPEFLVSNVSVHRRRLVRRTVERLVGLFIWFSAVLLWPIVLNVTVWSLFFALSMWKVQCTCGSLLFICPTSAFTFAPLVARNGGTPCWVPFSLAVPGFALRNRFRAVDALCFNSGGGSVDRADAYIF